MRKTTLWLCLICLGILAASAGAAEKQELLDSAAQAYSLGEYRKCADQYDAAISQGVQSPGILYNAACCCALSESIDQAFLYLNKAVEFGYHNTQWLQKDTDFQSLRDDNRWSGLIARCDSANEIYLQSINRELYQMFQEDQGDRLTGGAELDWSRIRERDAQHRARVKQMLDSGQVVAADDYYHAAMIFQHGDDTASYLLARKLALTAAELDSTNTTARWLAAASKDRYLWHIGKPQWYGTQLHMIDGKWTIDPIDTTAVTDEDRSDWQVPSLAEARRRAAQMNK